MPPALCALVAIHKLLIQFGALTQAVAEDRDRPSSQLICRSAGAFGVAAQLAMEGRPTECMAVVRQTIECAAYALLIVTSGEAHAAWAQRDGSPEIRRRCRAAFGASQLRGAIANRCPGSSTAFTDLYEYAN